MCRPISRIRWEANIPSIEENFDEWNRDYDWRLAGEAWSEAWGNSTVQWYACIYPRIVQFLPAQSILEIAPGFGRWTEFLLEYCDTLIGIDLSPNCVDACRRRFTGRKGVSFDTNDGHSLPTVASSSIDLAFSFDSLVHAEADVLGEYLKELARVLKPEGVAFLHHSNYGSYQRRARALAPLQGALDHLPGWVQVGLQGVGAGRNVHWRASTVNAACFVELCKSAGLRCIGQELVNWADGTVLLDCFSVVTRPGSRWDRPNRVVKNWLFHAQARASRRSSLAYYGASASRELDK